MKFFIIQLIKCTEKQRLISINHSTQTLSDLLYFIVQSIYYLLNKKYQRHMQSLIESLIIQNSTNFQTGKELPQKFQFPKRLSVINLSLPIIYAWYFSNNKPKIISHKYEKIVRNHRTEYRSEKYECQRRKFLT